MKTAQYLSDKIKRLQDEDHVWVTYCGRRLKLVAPGPLLAELQAEVVPHQQLTAFVKGRGKIRLARIWRHGTGARLHVSHLEPPAFGRYFRTNDKNVLAVVVEEYERG